MKKVIAILLILTLVSLVGCGQKQLTDTTTTTNVSEEAVEDAKVSEGISEAENLEDELNTSDVDMISDELEDLDW